MPALVHAPGDPAANTYVSAAEFSAYLDERLNAPSASPDDRARALIMATRSIDEEEFRGAPRRPLNGVPATETQALKWPRWGARSDGGWHYDPDQIPEIVKRATMELAIRILKDGPRDFLADPEADLQGIERFESVKVDTIAVKPRLRRAGGSKPRVVLDILAPVLITGRGQISLERG